MSAGLDVKLDRWNLTAGKRLWEQIATFICDPTKSDGWLLYATQASLGSEPCKEELADALDRALHTRGGDFPVIALFPASVDESLILASIRVRLHISLTDPDWKERIIAAVERRQAVFTKPLVEPYALEIHKLGERFAIEVRPRAGTWSPFIAAIPVNEKEDVLPYLHHGAAKRPPAGDIIMTMLYCAKEGVSTDGKWWLLSAANEATPTQSYYIFCKNLPSTLVFGVDGGSIQYQVPL